MENIFLQVGHRFLDQTESIILNEKYLEIKLGHQISQHSSITLITEIFYWIHHIDNITSMEF